MNYLLGVDLGTSGTKTVLFDEDGNVVASKTIEYPLYQEKNGWAEQAPEDWWDAICASLKTLLGNPAVDAGSIRAIAPLLHCLDG